MIFFSSVAISAFSVCTCVRVWSSDDLGFFFFLSLFVRVVCGVGIGLGDKRKKKEWTKRPY